MANEIDRVEFKANLPRLGEEDLAALQRDPVRTAAIPPPMDDSSVRRAVDAIKQVLDMREGRLGSPVERYVTWRDLMAAGLVGVNFKGRKTIGKGGDNVFPPPSEEDEAPDIPPTPQNLVASGGIGVIILTWDGINYLGHSYTEIWRASADNLSEAVMVGQSPGSIYSDFVGAGVYYYWIRFVNEKGNVGPWNSLAGTRGEALNDPGYLIQLLTGQITRSMLYESLGTQIDKITVLETQIAGIIDAPEYSPTTTYQQGDIVRYNGKLYAAKTTTLGNPPTDTTYWTLIGDYASLSEAVGGIAVEIDDLKTRVTATENGLTAEATARNSLAAQIRGTYTGNDIEQVTQGLIYQERTARATQDSALATQINQVSAVANANTAAIQNEATTRASADDALASQITTVQTTANLKVRTYYQASTPISGLTVGDLWVNTGESNKLYRWNGSSWVLADDQRIEQYKNQLTVSIQSEATTRATQTGDLFAKYTVKVDAAGHVAGFGLASEGNVFTGVTSQFGVRADRFWIAPPSIAQSTPPTSNRYHGMVWLDTSVNPPVTRYWNANTSSWTTTPTAELPFIVQTTPTVINGENVGPGVYLKDAFITNGAITTAKIGNAVITDAKIVDLAASKLKAGSIGVDQYIQSTNFISGAQGWRIHGNGNVEFSNAYLRGSLAVGSFVQSTNYVSGSSGWRIAADGTAEFGAAAIRGQLTASQIDTRGLTIKDAAGNVIFGSGATVNPSSYINAPSNWLNSNISISGGAITGIGAGSGTPVANSLISINSNGQLVNAGGGQVTISGLGYSGALDATRNRTWYGTEIPTAGNPAGAVDGDLYYQYGQPNGHNSWVRIAGTWYLSATQGALLDPSSNAAVKGQITSGNISTYIASGVITEAFIANATITEAKIANATITEAKIQNLAVSTLKIANNAVTIPAVDIRSDTVNGNGNWQTLCELWVNMPHAGWLLASFAGTQGYGFGVRTFYLRLFIDNWDNHTQVGGTAVDVGPSAVHAAFVGAGTHLVRASWYGEDSGVRVFQRTLWAQGAMR